MTRTINARYLKYNLCFIISFTLIWNGAHSKTFTTEDSIILEGDPPELPGPSIFEYRDNFYHRPPKASTVSKSSSSSSSSSATQLQEDSSNALQKVKRDNEEVNESPSQGNSTDDQPEHPRYFEIAGDELYVFEPSPMGVEPFMDAIIPERAHHGRQHQHQQSHAPPREIYHDNRQHSRHNHRQRQRFPNINHSPGTHYKNHIVIYEKPRRVHNFGNIKIEQVTPKDAIGPSISTVTASRSISSSSSQIQSNPIEGYCITTHDKKGQCVPFKVCYPVVFNLYTGELRNLGLARMLYQASGECEDNEFNKKALDIVVQPGQGGFSNSPFEISRNFYNHTVCCPGYIYHDSKIRYQEEISHDDNHKNHQERRPPKLKPSQLDPMLSPPAEGRGYPYHPHNQQHHAPQQSSQFPLPIFHEPLFDTEPDSNSNSEFDYYVDEFEDSYTTTTTESPPKKSVKEQNRSRNSTSTNHSKSGSDAVPELSSSPVKSKNDSIGVSKTKFEIESNPSNHETSTSSKSKSSSTKGQEENRKKIVRIHKSPIQQGPRDGKNKINGPVPTVVPPPASMTAWTCPGRQIGMPRGHWPWMVALLNEGSHFCTGSLVDHRHILTSATCVASFQGKDIGRMRAILGDRVIYSSADGPHLWRKILRITRHLQYNAETMEHDIAILEMDNPVSYSFNVQPINLPLAGSVIVHTNKAIVSGWSGPDIGKRFFTARPIVDAVVEFMGSTNCFKKFDGFISSGKVPHSIICTKPSNSTCKADLGAPLMMKTGNCWHIIGLLSNGLGCGGIFPDVFTDLSKHIPWIQKNIRQHS